MQLRSSEVRIYLFTLFLLIASLAAYHQPGTENQKAKQDQSLEAMNPHRDFTLVGKASWYGIPFHGRTTANGEKYNMNELTAAHKTLPFGSLVKVTNLINNKSVMVRINDRGPYIRGRTLDLSKAAALKLDMLHQGVASVKMEIYLAKNTKPRIKNLAKNQ